MPAPRTHAPHLRLQENGPLSPPFPLHPPAHRPARFSGDSCAGLRSAMSPAPSSSSSSKFKFKSLGLKVQAPGISPCCIRKVLLREMTQCSDLLYNEFMKVRDRILWHMRRLLHVTVFTVRYTILPIHFLPFPHFKKIIYDFIILFSYLHTCFKTPAIQPKSPRKAVSGNTYHLPSQTRVRNEVYASPADKEKLAAARGSNARAAGSPRSTKRHGRVPAQLTSEPWTPDPAH